MYSQTTLEFTGDTDSDYVTKWKGVGRCPTATDSFIYTAHNCPTSYNYNLGLGQPSWTGGAPMVAMPGWLGSNFTMSHALRNYLLASKRMGIFREEDLQSSPGLVTLFWDSNYSNRIASSGSSTGMFHCLDMEDGLHPGTDKLNIIFVDGHADNLDNIEWDAGDKRKVY
jgi:prepilin-type processing-associated H-X9-DG protein